MSVKGCVLHRSFAMPSGTYRRRDRGRFLSPQGIRPCVARGSRRNTSCLRLDPEPEERVADGCSRGMSLESANHSIRRNNVSRKPWMLAAAIAIAGAFPFAASALDVKLEVVAEGLTHPMVMVSPRCGSRSVRAPLARW